MENAAEALKMAAVVLVFMLALALFFTTFSKAKIASDSLLTMQDGQGYLESDDVENILYKSNEGIKADTTNYTSEGYRIVGLDSVISTIYRYDKEKFGVTIMQSNGTVIARYDSATESLINNWNNIQDVTQKENYTTKLKNNLKVRINTSDIENNLNTSNELKNLYEIKSEDGSTTVGAPWYGNSYEIINRINADITGDDYKYNGQTYTGKKLKQYIGNKFIEITKEIDNSEYLEDGGNTTDLLKEYQMPTVEVIYIIK